jgi:hypothetical protein
VGLFNRAYKLLHVEAVVMILLLLSLSSSLLRCKCGGDKHFCPYLRKELLYFPLKAEANDEEFIAVIGHFTT